MQGYGPQARGVRGRRGARRPRATLSDANHYATGNVTTTRAR